MASLSTLHKSDGIVFDSSQPSVDLTVSYEADQQRSGQIYTEGYSGALGSSEYFASYQCALAAKAFSNTEIEARELLFTSTTAEKDTSAFTTNIVLRTPKLSRGSALIVVRCARLMDSADSKDPYEAQNPANQAWHYLGLKIGAKATTSISRTPIENKDVKQLFHKNAVDIVESEPDCDHQTPHCILQITTTQVVAQGLKIPALGSAKAQEHLANLVNIAESATATSPATFRFLVREDDAAEYEQVFQDYATQVNLEQGSDPVKQLWYKKSPNKAVLDVGTMMDILDVPDIPVQSAELVFTDKLEYMRAHGYGAKFENEFQKLYVNDYKGVTFHMKAVEMEYAKSSPDAQCETYAVIIDTAGHNVARPQFNSSLVVTMDLPVPEAQTYMAPEIKLDDGVGFDNDDNSQDNAITSAHEEEMRKEAVRSTKKALPQTLTMLNAPSPSSHKKERKAKKAAMAAIAKASRRSDNADSTNISLPKASKGFPPPTSSPTKSDRGKQAQAAEDELQTEEEVDAQLAPSQTDLEPENVSTDIGTVLEDASLYDADYETREDDYMDVDPGDEVDTDNNSKNHNAWRFQVQKAPAGLLDPGQIYGFIERRREPGWTGPRKDRPFVLTDIPCSNDRWSTVIELKVAFEEATVIDVTLAPDHSEQPYKDCIRAMDTMHRSINKGTNRLFHKIIGTLKKSDEKYSSILDQMDDINLHKDFTKSQKDARIGLGKICERIHVVHGGYGTGKTGTTIKLAIEFMAYKERRNTVLYTTPSNEAVDDAASRMFKVLEDYELDKTIIRVHSLKGEKGHAFRHYVKDAGFRSRFHPENPELTPEFLNEFLMAARLRDAADMYEKSRKTGDPRRRLANLTLSEAMHRYIEKHEGLEHQHEKVMKSLNVKLRQVGRGVTLNPQEKGDLKAKLSEVLAWTLADADAIFCTTNTATKVNLKDNIDPKLVILDEACRASEIETLGVMAFYDPDAWWLIGDPSQLSPPNFSADRELYEPKFKNPFHPQRSLSLHERLSRNGHPVHYYREQHRCNGNISHWPNDHFYPGIIVNVKRAIAQSTKNIRLHLNEKYGLERTNTVLFELQDSQSQKDPGGESSTNKDHVHKVLEAVIALLDDSKFISLKDQTSPGHITIMTYYLAQKSCYEDELELLDTKYQNRIAVCTVHSMQGKEDDAVFVDTVRSAGPGFTGEPRAMCVATTRAHDLMVYVINPNILDGVPNPHRSPNAKHIDSLIKHHQLRHTVVTISCDVHGKVCLRCKETGHTVRTCKEPDPRACRNCGQLGHRRDECPNPVNFNNYQCKRCGERGHIVMTCPMPKPKRCRNCSQFGHEAKNCPSPVNIERVRCNKCKLFGIHETKDCDYIPTRQNFQSHLDQINAQKQERAQRFADNRPGQHDTDPTAATNTQSNDWDDTDPTAATNTQFNDWNDTDPTAATEPPATPAQTGAQWAGAW